MSIILFLFLLVFASGCTNPFAKAEPAGNNDVAVFTKQDIAQSFTQGGSNFSEIAVQNLGDPTIALENVNIDLYDPGDLKITDVVCFPGERLGTIYPACPPPGFIGPPVPNCGQPSILRGCHVDKLEYKEIMDVQYFLKAPIISKIQNVKDTIRYSVGFDYSVTNSLQIPITSEASLVAKTQTSTVSETSSQYSPIKITMTTIPKVLVDSSFSIKTEFANIGTGGNIVGNKIPTRWDEETKKLSGGNDLVSLRLPLDITIDSDNKDDCDWVDITSTSPTSVRDVDGRRTVVTNTERTLIPKYDIVFPDGKNAQPLSCSFIAQPSILAGTPEQVVDIRAKIDHFRYEFRRSATATLYALK